MDLCLFRTVYKRLTLLCLIVFAFSAVVSSQRYVTNEVTDLVASPDAGGQYHYYMITAGDATLMIDGSGNVTAGSQADSTFTYFYYDGTRLIGAYNFSTTKGKQDVTDRVVYTNKVISGGGINTSTDTNLDPAPTTWVTLVTSNNNIGFKNKPFVLSITTTYLLYDNGWNCTSGLEGLVGSTSGTTLKFYEITDLVISTDPKDAVPERTITFSHNPGQANTGLNKNGMQDVHELVFEAYLAPGETRELVMPVGSGSAPHAYFRWYNYDTDGASNAITANLTHSVEGYVRTDWGNIIANDVTTSGSSIQGNTMFTYDGNPITIACDASNYADFPTLTRDDTDTITDITEPTLSYRTIYKIRSSSEIAARLSACTSTPLEEYDFVTPSDSIIMLTTAMKSYGSASNYFYTATDRDAAPMIYKSTTSPISGYDAGSTPTVYSNRMYQLQAPPAGSTWYYELRANGGQYIIARWMVTGMAISSVGPSTSEINTTLNDEFTLSAEQNFDNLGGKDYSFEGGNISDRPLRWSECSYGFTYPAGSGTAGTDRVVNGGHYFTNWGEYAIVKTTPSKSWLVSSVKSHTNPGTGSYMYVDANEAPGVVSNLIVDGNLCPGSEIIVSAWVVSHTTSGTKPNLTFNLIGVNANGTEDRIQSYTTGKNTLINAGTWYNILFRVTLGTKRYSQYRVKIENNNNSAAGNDFGIDDIKIYTTKSPLTAVEAITACDIKTQQELLDVEQGKGARTVILRVDFKNTAFPEDKSGNVNMKYAWIDDTEFNPNFTTLPLKYFNHEPYSIAGNVVGNVGSLSFPKNFTIEQLRTAGEPIYSSLADYFANATVADSTYFFIEEEGKYMNESTNKLETRIEPVLYIVHKDTCFKRYHEYSCMLTTSDEFNSDCGGFFTTKIQNCKQLLIDGEPQETTNLRFKTLGGEKDYNLSVQVYYNDTDDKGKVKAATPMCDWICGVDDRFIEASLTRSFVKFRSEYPDATSLDQEIKGVFTQGCKDSLMAYADKIQLYKRSVIANVPGDGTSVQYVAYAIAGSCDDPNIAVCPNPLRVRLRSDVRFSLGKRANDDMPEDIQGAPAVIRIAESFVNEPDSHFTMMVNYVKGSPLVEGKMYLYRTTDTIAQKLLGIHTYNFTPNVVENNTHTYTRIANDLEMLPGYEYKFSARFEDAPFDTAYGCFIVKVVPDIVIFNPENENSNWHNDDFWKDTADNVAFIPVAGTKVILPAGNTILEDYDVNSFEDIPGVTYHLNYNYGVAANTCGSVYFPAGAAMYGQKFLTYDSAYVDVPVTSENYSLTGLPLQEVYSGDIFMPLAGDKSGKDFLFNPAMCDNRIANRMFQKVYNSTTTYHYYLNGQNYDSVSTAIAGWGNPSHDLTKVYNNTAIAVKAQADNVQDFIQLPKRDTVYYYYAIRSSDGKEYQVPERYGKGDVNRSADYAKLLFDKNANPFTFTYENVVADNWFLVVNPFMGNLSVSQFMSANAELTDGFYYDYTDGVMTAVPVEENTVIKPAGAFFVHTKTPATQLTLTFNSDMADATLVKKSAAPATLKGDRQMLTITATSSDYSSKATLEEDSYCHNDYNAREDADMLLFDAGLTPFGVYTRYNDKALMVNAVNTISMIPMSVSFVDTVVDINIRFIGVDNFDNTLYLYDKLTNQYTEITEGMTIGWSGLESDADRYYINIDRSEIITSDEENYSNDDCIITVDGNKVTVISGENIKSVKAYDIAGKLISVEPIITAVDCTFTLPSGVYVLEVETENKVSNNKVIIK
ncbi:MAG: T9SS type A sorting domain-containing protein [Candidatus Aphodosoma sp.]